jgi:hypothetical protein
MPGSRHGFEQKLREGPRSEERQADAQRDANGD